MRRIKFSDEGSSFDRAFRDNLRNASVEPSADVWSSIDSELNAEQEKVKHDHWYYALLFLLIPLTVINTIVTYDLGAEKFVFDEGMSSSQSPTSRALACIDYYTPAQLFTTGSDNQIAKEYLNRGSSNKTPVFHSSNYHSKDYLTEMHKGKALEFVIQQEPVSINNNEVMLASIEPISSIISDDQPKPIVSGRSLENYHKSVLAGLKGPHFGVLAGFNGSWLFIQNNVLEPLVGEGIDKQIDGGPFFGVSMGYDFSSRVGLQAEWIFKSMQGQRYRELKYEKLPIEGKIDLQYMHVPLFVKVKWPSFSRANYTPRSINLLVGLQYSRLSSAKIIINEESHNVSSALKHNELGLALGIEYDQYLTKNLYLSVGLRGSYSSDATAYFQSRRPDTYNVLIGVNASLNYRVLRKARKRLR